MLIERLKLRKAKRNSDGMFTEDCKYTTIKFCGMGFFRDKWEEFFEDVGSKVKPIGFKDESIRDSK